jgi:hypothetical protein
MRVHKKPGTDDECPEALLDETTMCGACGWIDVGGIVADAARTDPGLAQRMTQPPPPDAEE